MQLEKHDNGVYYIHWSEGRRSKRVSTRATSLDAAKAFLAQWLVMEREQPSLNGRFTCGDIWRLYDAKHVEAKVASPDAARYCWRNLESYFGAMAVVDVDQDVVDAYVKKRVSGKLGRAVKPATVRKELVMLRASWGWAASSKRKLLQPKDVPAFDIPRGSPPRTRWLTEKELGALFEAAVAVRRGPLMTRGERFLWLAAFTGARKGAICDLTWDRVDFEIGVIHYRKPGQHTTSKRRASVPISGRLLPALERMHAERQSDLVVGEPNNVYRALGIIAKHAGVEGVTPHVLRHTAATHMARHGVPLHKIAQVLGNSAYIVESVYAHHTPEAAREAIERMYSREAVGANTQNGRATDPTWTFTET